MLSSWLNFVGGYPKTAPSRFPHKLPEQSSAFSRELFPDFLLLVSTTCRRVPDEMCTNIGTPNPARGRRNSIIEKRPSQRVPDFLPPILTAAVRNLFALFIGFSFPEGFDLRF